MTEEDTTRRKSRRDLLLVLLILPFGVLCMFMAGQAAIILAPKWVLDAEMRSLLDPNAEFAAGGLPFFLEPLNPGILTPPAWGNFFLTPRSTIPTRVILTSTPPPPVNTPPPPPVLVTPDNPVQATATSSGPIIIIVPTRGGSPRADLLIEKSDNSSTYTPGTAIRYTILVTNLGPDDAPFFDVTDIVPAVISGLTVNCTPIAHCGTNTSKGNTVSFSGASLPHLGANQLAITISGTVVSGATGDLVNTANVVVPAGVNVRDPNPANDIVTDTDIQLSVYDLAITKSDGVDTYTTTAPINYTIVVTNSGPSDALGVSVTDNKPPQIASWTWTCITLTNPTCTGTSSSSNFTDTVDIQSGGRIEYSVRADPSPAGALENVSNTVNVVFAADPNHIDPNLTNNSATDIDIPYLDLQITKDDGVATYTTPGSTLTYSVIVTNNSTFNLSGVTITDNFPALVTSWQWICLAQNGGASGCDPASPGLSDFTDTVDLPGNGGNIIYNVIATVHDFAAGTLENTATAYLPAGLIDQVPGNNTATDSDINVIGEPDIGLPDGNIYWIPDSGTATFYLSQPIAANGDLAADFVFYELPVSPGIFLDHVIVEISVDSVTWYPVFFWGDSIADTNTNVDYINLPNIATACPTEVDNCPVPTADLYPYPGTGIAIDVDSSPLSGPLPQENYHWIRFTEPGITVDDGTHVDAIQILP